MWQSNIPKRHVKAIALRFFVAATVKLQEFVINEPGYSPSEKGSNWSTLIDQLGNADWPAVGRWLAS